MKNNEIIQIKYALKELIQDSTSHGIPRIIKSKHFFIKLVWVFCFLVSTGICFYSISRTAEDYFNYEFSTQIERIREAPAVFPTTKFCNLNLYPNADSIAFKNNFLSNNSFLNQYPAYQQNYFILNELFFFNDSYKQSLGLSLNQSVINCLYSGEKCNYSYFSWTFDPLYGNCFRFNTGQDNFGNKIDLLNLNKPGNLNGLRLELFIGNPDLIQDIIEGVGYHVMVNNATVFPSYNEGFDISTGTSSNLAIDRLFTCRLSEPYNDCLENLDQIDSFDSDLYRTIIKSNKTYRQNDCFDLCYQSNVINNCRCYVNTFDKLNGTVPCNTRDEINCSLKEFKKYINSNVNSVCSHFCPLECNSVTLQAKLSFSDYPSKSYAENKLAKNPFIVSHFGNQTITFEKLKMSVLYLNIYYEELGYTFTSQQPKMQFFDIISNIGGLFGLFIGISFLSFIEIFEAFYEVLYTLLKKKNSIS